MESRPAAGLEDEMHEALLYDRLDDGTAHCRVCPWECRVAPGEHGRCLVRQNQEGAFYALNYGLIAAAAIDPIERRRPYHLFPGCTVLSLGSWGSNLPCRLRPAPAELPAAEQTRYLDAERAAAFAVERRCRGLAWAFQEPAVWLEYVLDSAKMARANGLFTFMETNGYVTKEAWDLLGPYLDACTVELLAATAAPYEHLCSLAQFDPILESAAYLWKQWRCHVEIITPLVAGVNDGRQIVQELASWIAEVLGPDTPWHLCAPQPAGEMADHPPVPREILERTGETGKQAGLRYVYLHGSEPPDLAATLCPSCGNLLIRREGQFNVKVVGIEGNACAQCGEPIHLRRSIFK